MNDYITGLRQDLVEAAARQQAAGRGARVARPLRPRAWSPVAVLGSAAALAAAVVLVVGLRAVTPSQPPSAPKVVATYHLGGEPRDATFAGGALVVANVDGSAVVIDPAHPRDRHRLQVGATPNSVAADGSSVWVASVHATANAHHASLLQVDARTGRRLARVSLRDGYVSHVAVGAGGVWMACDLETAGLARIDPRSHRRTAYLPGVDVQGVAASDDAVWTRASDTVTQWDAAGRVVNRVSGVSSALGDQSQHTMLADAHGAWVVGQGDGVLYRIEHGAIVRRIRVGATAGAIGGGGSTVWVMASPGTGENELVRVDAEERNVTARLALGRFDPEAVVPVGRDVWLVARDGELRRVSQG
jgi:hypothetical protein